MVKIESHSHDKIEPLAICSFFISVNYFEGTFQNQKLFPAFFHDILGNGCAENRKHLKIKIQALFNPRPWFNHIKGLFERTTI